MKLFPILFLSLAAFAQSTGSVVVSQTVTATAQQADTDPHAIVCVAVPVVDLKAVSVICKVAGQIGLAATYYIQPGSTATTNAAVASYSYGGNIITWMLYQPDPAGPITWQVSANGTARSDQF